MTEAITIGGQMDSLVETPMILNDEATNSMLTSGAKIGKRNMVGATYAHRRSSARLAKLPETSVVQRAKSRKLFLQEGCTHNTLESLQKASSNKIRARSAKVWGQDERGRSSQL